MSTWNPDSKRKECQFHFFPSFFPSRYEPMNKYMMLRQIDWRLPSPLNTFSLLIQDTVLPRVITGVRPLVGDPHAVQFEVIDFATSLVTVTNSQAVSVPPRLPRRGRHHPARQLDRRGLQRQRGPASWTPTAPCPPAPPCPSPCSTLTFSWRAWCVCRTVCSPSTGTACRDAVWSRTRWHRTWRTRPKCTAYWARTNSRC